MQSFFILAVSCCLASTLSVRDGPSAPISLAHSSRSVATVEGDPSGLSKQRSKHAGHQGMGVFHMIMKEWKELPEQGAFVENCTKQITALLPILRVEYTALNVPRILTHECDVYATKEDYMTNNTSQEEARSNCRYCARRLGVEFNGNKDYKGWCEGVHVYLDQQLKLHVEKAAREKAAEERDAVQDELDKLREQYHQLKKGHIAKELDKLHSVPTDDKAKLPCCKDCRMCDDHTVPFGIPNPFPYATAKVSKTAELNGFGNKNSTFHQGAASLTPAAELAGFGKKLNNSKA